MYLPMPGAAALAVAGASSSATTVSLAVIVVIRRRLLHGCCAVPVRPPMDWMPMLVMLMDDDFLMTPQA